jgi:hypothetical protein
MKKWLWVLLGGIVLLWAAFWYLNFRIAASNTKSEHNHSTTIIGDGLPQAMQGREKINLVLIGEGPLIGALPNALAAEMNKAGMEDIELMQGIEPDVQSPALVVKVGKPDLLWTPFFATSQFTIQAGYSSTGDTAFMGETQVIIDNKEGPVLNMYGEYKVSDRSWGLISRPSYLQTLAKYLAREIVSTLKDLYRVRLP